MIWILAFSIFAAPVVAASPIPSTTPSPAALPGQIWINELFPNPVGTDTGQEWAELYNPTNQTVSIGGLKLARLSGSTLATIPADTMLPAHGYHHLNSLSGSLINTGDTIVLNAGSVEIDRVTYDEGPEGWSWSRLSASEGMWTEQPTPGQANAFVEPVPTTEPVSTSVGTAGSATTKASAANSTKAATKKATASKTKATGLPKSGPGLAAYLVPLGAAAVYCYRRWKP